MRILLASLALLVVSAAPAAAFRNFIVSSSIMMPMLDAGDVATAAFYGIDLDAMMAGRPFLAPDDPRFQPKRGDVVFFTARDGSVYVSRIVGLEGERLSFRKGMLQIDGVPVKTEEVGAVEGGCPESAQTCAFHRETLPGGASHIVLDTVAGSPGDDTAEKTVPPGHVFVLGDNRDNANDSRFAGEDFNTIGFVSRGSIIGRLYRIVSSPRSEPPLSERERDFPDLR